MQLLFFLYSNVLLKFCLSHHKAYATSSPIRGISDKLSILVKD